MKTTSSACLILALSFHAFASERSIADQQKQYQDHLDWAKGAQQAIPEKAKDQLNLNDYCDSAECINQVRNPPQKGLNDAAIKQQKAREFLADETANAVKSQFDKGRPDIKSDPATRFALLGQEQAYAITHGISNAYVDCQDNTQCRIDNVTRVCNSPTNNPVSCFRTPRFATQSLNATKHCPGQIRGDTCIECRYNEPRNYVHRLYYQGDKHRLRFHWDGRRIIDTNFVPINQTSANGYYMGALKRRHDYATTVYQICRNTPVIKTCPTGFNLVGNLCVRNTLSWETDCALVSQCSPIRERCLEGAETRLIHGVPTYLSCWKVQVDYQCNFPDTCAGLARDCTTTSSHCSILQNGVCVEKEYIKTCPVKTCSTTKLHCLDTTFCLDGDCYGATPTQSDDFAKSAAGLAALSEAAKGLGNPPRIFAGQGMHCTDKAFGFADCCKDSGWGTDIGLAKCSEQEKALGQAKEQGLTIALGSYCATKVLGACVRKKKGYCVFGSKLARIVQAEGARDQLGLSFGSAEHPKCEALTPEQLQAIRFDRIDFSDFFEDMRGNAQLPSAEEIQERLRSAYGE